MRAAKQADRVTRVERAPYRVPSPSLRERNFVTRTRPPGVFLASSTELMRALLRSFVLGPLLAATFAVAAGPPSFLRWRSYEEPDFPPRLLSTVVRDGFAAVMFTFDDHGRITDRV